MAYPIIGQAIWKWIGMGLVMMRVVVGFAKILLGFLVERHLIAERAEVVGLTLVLRRASGGRGVNVHAADGID